MELRKIIDGLKDSLLEVDRAIEIFEGELAKKQVNWYKRCAKNQRKKPDRQMLVSVPADASPTPVALPLHRAWLHR